MSAYNYGSKSASQPDPYGSSKMPSEMLIGMTASRDEQPERKLRKKVKAIVEVEPLEENLLVCPVCGMVFKQQGRYDKHVRLHNGIDTSGIA